MNEQWLDSIIKELVRDVCSKKQIPNDIKLVQTDNFGEIVEKLIIIHIRMWMLEDLLGVTDDPFEIRKLKSKTDTCFKIKRPRLVEAINLIISDAIRNNKSLVEQSVKMYEGIDK